LGNELDHGGITRFDGFGFLFDLFTGTSVDLGDELLEFAGDVSSVAIEDGGITSTNLTGVVEDDDLGSEVFSFLGGVVIRVGADESSSDILDGDVLDVESDVVTGCGFSECFVMHFDGLDFSGKTGGGEADNISSFKIPVSTLPTGTVPIPPIL
jgi:hypothetical protein